MSADLPPLRADATNRSELVRPLLVATLLGLFVSELFVVVGPLETGLFGYVVVLGVAAVAGTAGEDRRVFLVVATLTSCRLVSVGAPDIAGVRPVVVAYLGTFVALVVFLEADDTPSIESAPTVAGGVVAGVAGLGLGVLAVVVMGGSPASFAFPTSLTDVVVLLALVPLVTVVDELLFRRLLYPALRTAFEPVSAFGAVCLLYAAAAPATGQFESASLALAAGLVLGLVYEWTRDTITVVALHAGIVAALVVTPVVV